MDFLVSLTKKSAWALTQMLRRTVRFAPQTVVDPVLESYRAVRNVMRQMKARLIPFDIVFPDAQKYHESPVQTVEVPEIESMCLYKSAAHLMSNQYTTPADYVASVDNALYCPFNNVVLDTSRRVVAESLNISFIQLDTRKLRSRDIVRLDGTYALCRSRANNYYHTIVDNLPRIVALSREPFSEFDQIRLLCPGGATATESFFLSKFGLANVQVLPLEQGTLYQLEHLVFTPFKSKVFSGFLPKWYVDRFRHHVFPNRPSKRNRRILISREKAARQRRNFTNREKVDRLLDDFGFEKHYPEFLSLDEQIDMFYDAEVVVAAHGAGLTNCVYAPPGLKVVSIFPSTQINPAYYLLCTSLGHRFSWICGDSQSRNPVEFTVDLGELTDTLSALGVGA